MKKKIAILGSTGTIGTSTLAIVSKDISKFSVELLTANTNYKKLIAQAIKFKAKNILIYNEKFYSILKKRLKKYKIKIYCGNISLKKIISKKIDYTMCATTGIVGLKPTLDSIKISRVVAIANKESIICGWHLIEKLTRIYKTKIYPVDSEHFSIMQLTSSCNNKDIQEIILTASGGPFLKSSIKSLKQKKPSSAIKHPRWKMGKKISIDSANLMNKVFEIFEAYSFFKFDYNKFKILIHPQSYVHAIVRYTNGLIKMILHDTDMKIPIANTLYGKDTNIKNIKDINPRNFSNLHFEVVDPKRFPSLTLLKVVKKNNYMAPTILNASNEELVKLFLDGEINFTDIVKILKKITKSRDFKRFSKKRPKTINDIMYIDQWARLKTQSLSVE